MHKSDNRFLFTNILNQKRIANVILSLVKREFLQTQAANPLPTFLAQ